MIYRQCYLKLTYYCLIPLDLVGVRKGTCMLCTIWFSIDSPCWFLEMDDIIPILTKLSKLGNPSVEYWALKWMKKFQFSWWSLHNNQKTALCLKVIVYDADLLSPFVILPNLKLYLHMYIFQFCIIFPFSFHYSKTSGII